MSVSLTHKNLIVVSPNCLRLVWGQSRAVTLPKQCVVCSKLVFKWHKHWVATQRNAGKYLTIVFGELSELQA